MVCNRMGIVKGLNVHPSEGGTEALGSIGTTRRFPGFTRKCESVSMIMQFRFREWRC